MNPKNDGGPAFPSVFTDPASGPEVYLGITVRDYFAARALESAFPQFRAGGFELTRNDLAQSCWEMADAMLAERSK